MSKKFSLPKKKSATEAATPVGAGFAGIASMPVDTTNFRRDFQEQAKQLKEKISVGVAPKRVEHPKNNLTLDKDGKLKGEIDVLEESKEKSQTIDLQEQAKAVNESVKRPVFKRKSASAAEAQTIQDPQTGFEVGYKFKWKRDNYKSTFTVTKSEDDPTAWGARNITVVSDTGDEVTMPVGNFNEIKGAKLIRPAKEATYSNDTRENDVCTYNDFVACTDEQQNCSTCSNNPANKKAEVKTEGDNAEPIKDERDSDDKQPTEAVACEGEPEYDDTFYSELADMEEDLLNSQDDPDWAGSLLYNKLMPAFCKDGKDVDKRGKMFLGAFRSDSRYFITKVLVDWDDGTDEKEEDYYISLKDDVQSIIDNEPTGNLSIATEDIETPTQEKGEPVKDERESQDKQPTEAVACESRFQAFNKREQGYIDSGDVSSVRTAMKNGSLSKVRGRQILYTMGATEDATEDVEFPQATDKGKPVDDASADVAAKAKTRASQEEIEGYIDTEIGDNLGCDVVYTSKTPIAGQVNKLTKETAIKVTKALEDFGVSARVLSAKEDFSVLFTTEEQVPTIKWYALVTDKKDVTKVLQLTITASSSSTQAEVEQYLRNIYGADGVLRVSPTKIA
ncbi:MAG: hypothetical protein NC218_01310 [Acetobacter sp.]|nr:hypothetical protein [Acetobacter sp.]